MNALQKLGPALMLAVVLALAWPLTGRTAARVIDVDGEALRAAPQAPRALALFDTLNPRDHIELSAGGQLTLIFDDAGQQLRLKGPGRWEIDARGARTLRGAPPQDLPAAQPALRPLTLGRSRVTAGAAAMRNAAGMDLSLRPDATRLLAPPVTLDWSGASDGTRYKVTLATADGQAVYEGTQAGTMLSIPAASALQPGTGYAWSVEVRSGPHQGARAFAAFTVADGDTGRQWASLRPGDDGPVSHWVLYAQALDSAGFTRDAADAWQQVRKRRPGLHPLRAP